MTDASNISEDTRSLKTSDDEKLGPSRSFARTADDVKGGEAKNDEVGTQGHRLLVPTKNPLPPVPTTKILAISHFTGTPMTPDQRAQIMPHEVHDTVNAYLAGKIDQWYFRTDGKGVVFIVNASTPEEAKNILEKFPLGQAGLMGFDYIPLGPLSPLRIINDMVK